MVIWILLSFLFLNIISTLFTFLDGNITQFLGEKGNSIPKKADEIEKFLTQTNNKKSKLGSNFL